MYEDKDGVKGLENVGRKHLRQIHRNLPTARLYQEIIRNREGQVALLGHVVTRTGHFTELPPGQRYIVKDPGSAEQILWTEATQAILPEQFATMFARLIAYMQTREAYVQTAWAGMDPDHRVSLRIITETAWHNLFVRNLYPSIHPPGQGSDFVPDWTIAHGPGFISIPDVDGTNSTSFVGLDLTHKVLFIGGTAYAGEIRHAVFTILSHVLHEKGVFSMRCASSVGKDGGVALFMGRRGSGKTTLATDPERLFMGDHGHGWDDKGLFAFEKGCYAKILGITPENHPELYAITRQFGTVLENAAIDPDTTRLDLFDRSLGENVRAAYPATHLPGHLETGMAGHPENIFFLTCDAFGVLPPLAKLTPEQAVYAFLSSYTSVFKEDHTGPSDPNPMFSTCFGTCPLSIEPHEYAMRFMDRIKAHKTKCWLMNTGWVGEPYGRGERMDIKVSRALVRAVVSGALDSVAYEQDPVFEYEVPQACPEVDPAVLNPREAAADPGEYEVRANRLAEEFMKDFSRFGDTLPENIRSMLSSVMTIEDVLDAADFSLSM